MSEFLCYYCILDFVALSGDGLSPGNTLYSISDRPSAKASSSMTSVSTSECENVPLTNKTRVKKKKAPKQEQSLYSYFSSPVASPRSSQHDTSVIDRQEQTFPTGKNLVYIVRFFVIFFTCSNTVLSSTSQKILGTFLLIFQVLSPFPFYYSHHKYCICKIVAKLTSLDHEIVG